MDSFFFYRSSYSNAKTGPENVLKGLYPYKSYRVFDILFCFRFKVYRYWKSFYVNFSSQSGSSSIDRNSFIIKWKKKSLCFSLDRFPVWKHVLKSSLKLCNNAISAVSLFCVGYVFLNNNCRFPGLGALSVVVKSAVARRCLREPTSMFAMYQNNSMQHRKGRMVQRLKDYSAIVCIVENK